MKLHDVNNANPSRRLVLGLFLHAWASVEACLVIILTQSTLLAGLLVLQLLTQMLTAYLNITINQRTN